MKIKIVIGIIFLFATTAYLIDRKSSCNCNSIDQDKKDGKMLYNICSYLIKSNKILPPANPCEYEIKEIVEDSLDRKPVLYVKLNCCYLGDRILIDKQTNKIIDYIPEDK